MNVGVESETSFELFSTGPDVLDTSGGLSHGKPRPSNASSTVQRIIPVPHAFTIDIHENYAHRSIDCTQGKVLQKQAILRWGVNGCIMIARSTQSGQHQKGLGTLADLTWRITYQ